MDNTPILKGHTYSDPLLDKPSLEHPDTETFHPSTTACRFLVVGDQYRLRQVLANFISNGMCERFHKPVGIV